MHTLCFHLGLAKINKYSWTIASLLYQEWGAMPRDGLVEDNMFVSVNFFVAGDLLSLTIPRRVYSIKKEDGKYYFIPEEKIAAKEKTWLKQVARKFTTLTERL